MEWKKTLFICLSNDVKKKYSVQKYKCPDNNNTRKAWDFHGGPVAKTSRFQCRGRMLDPWEGN